MLVTKYEHEHNTNTGSAAAGGGCVYLCPLFAPILLARGYHHPQFEITAEVSVYKNRRKIADKIMTEKSVSLANLVNAGDAEFRAQLEDMTLHNFTVSLLKVLETS